MADLATSPILIVGSGPSGLVAALTLLRNGVPVRIIEKNNKFHDGQRGAGIQPRSLELYNFLGVSEVMVLAEYLKPTCVYELPGGTKPKFMFEMLPKQDPTPGVPFANGMLLGQHHTEEILRAHIAKYGIHVELGTELVGFEQDEDGVTVHLRKTALGQDTTEAEDFRTPFLIAGDGAKSIIRKLLGLEFSGVSREAESMLFGDLYLTGLGSDHWHSWGDMATKGVTLRPTEYPGRFQFIAAGHAEFKSLLNDREAFIKFVEDVTDRKDLGIGEITGLSKYHPNIRMVKQFGKGRVFVVGGNGVSNCRESPLITGITDAAHVHSPTGGQGMNSSIQDSFNLGWKVALIYKHLSPLSLLSTYSEERVPVIQQMLERTTDLLNKATTAKAEDVDAIKAAWARPKSLHQLGVNYRWSSIVIDEQHPYHAADQSSALDPYGDGEFTELRAGDRAPDAPGLVNTIGDTQTSLFSLFKSTHHTIILFTSDLSEIGPIVKVLSSWPVGQVKLVVVAPKDTAIGQPSLPGVDLVLRDQAGHGYNEYRSVVQTNFKVVVIRPDGVIGGILKDEEGLKRYSSGILYTTA